MCLRELQGRGAVVCSLQCALAADLISAKGVHNISRFNLYNLADPEPELQVPTLLEFVYRWVTESSCLEMHGILLALRQTMLRTPGRIYQQLTLDFVCFGTLL